MDVLSSRQFASPDLATIQIAIQLTPHFNMPSIERLDSSRQDRLSVARIAKASALAPLLLVIPLLVFVVGCFWLDPLPALEDFGLMPFVIVGVLPIYIGLVMACLALTFALRALGHLTRRSLFIASTAVSIAIGLLFLPWASEASVPFSEQLKWFAFGAGVYLLITFGMSWFWWRIANVQVRELSYTTADK